MKKLMITAAIVCAAVVSQAAQINWSTGTSSFWSDSTGTPQTSVPTGGELVLVLMKGGLDWDHYTVIPTVSSVTSEKTTLSINTKDGSVGQVKGSVKFTYVADAGNNFIENGDVLALMFKDTATGDISQLVYAGTDPEQAAATYLTVSGLSGNNTTKTLATIQTANFTSADVPEPTSAMLLVLGLGALALRRKQA